MGALHKFWADASVDNHSKYLIFLAIPTNLLLWGCEIWALRTSLLKKLEVFLHHSIRRILDISMSEVKDQHITNETVRNFFPMYPKLKTYCNTTANIHWKIGTQLWQPSSHQTFHCMVQTQATIWRCTANEQKSIVHNLQLIIPEVDNTEHSKHGRILTSMTDTGNT